MKVVYVKVFVILLILSQSLITSARPRINVDQAIFKYVNKYISLGKDLHEFSYTRNKDQILQTILKMEAQEKEINKIVIKDGISASHLLELISDSRKAMVKAKTKDKQKQRDLLKVAFEKITRIVQRYDFGRHRVFYCQKYKDLWTQRHWVAKNPINITSRCGVLAN